MPKKRRHIDSPSWSRYIPASELRVDPSTGRSVGPDGRATGVLVLPELTVTPRKVSASLGAMPSQYDMAHADDKYYNGYVLNAGDFLDAITLGGLNNLSPTQWARRLYDLTPLVRGDMNGSDYINRWAFGNEGIVSADFANRHPYGALAINAGTDILTGGAMAGRKYIGNAIKDKVGFVERPNSFTRGIGGRPGLVDLVGSGKVRGNPRGTEVSAHNFGKLWRSNRDDFASIMRDTGLEDIQLRFFNRTLTKEDFDAIKQAALKYSKPETKPTKKLRFDFGDYVDKDPLYSYDTYDEYVKSLRTFRPTTVNDDGQPLAYFYNNGRNPFTKGHDYAKSKYGVRINNVDKYNPFMHNAHRHYSLGKTPSLYDPNVEVFVNTKLGTIKIPKWYLKYNKLLKKAYIPYEGEPSFKYGGTIHIKPKNRGKFNALKKRTGKTTEELTHSKNPLTRKRAIFAQNARKWNHKKK